MEPLSIFSLGVTVLGILLGTIPGLIDKAEQIKNYEERLTRYRRTLENCHWNLLVWQAKWEQTHEKYYEELFGASGWRRIKERKEAIRKLADNILDHLGASNASSPTTNEHPPTAPALSGVEKLKAKLIPSAWSKRRPSATPSVASMAEPAPAVDAEEGQAREDWRIYVHSLNDGNDPPILKDTVVSRILGTFYENQQLDRKLSQLEKDLNDLHAFSRNLYGTEGPGEPDKSPSKKEIAEAMRSYRFERVARELYTSYVDKQRSHQWALEMHLPDDLEQVEKIVERLVVQGLLIFTVKFRLNPDSALSSQEIRVVQIDGALIPLDVGSSLIEAMGNILARASQAVKLEGIATIQLKQNATPTLWTQSLRHLLAKIQLDKSRGEEELGKIFSLERAKVAFASTLWMILLWRTNWFDHLCTCGFRSALFRVEQSSELFPLGPASVHSQFYRMEHVFRTQPRNGQNHPCPRQYTSKNKLYLLGILLAELILAEPIDLEVVGGRLQPSTRSRFRDNQDIIDDLEKYRLEKHLIALPVRFCLNNALTKEWTNSQLSISKEQTNELINKVLIPIGTYYEHVKKNFTDYWAAKALNEARKLADADLLEEIEHDAAAPAGELNGVVRQAQEGVQIGLH